MGSETFGNQPMNEPWYQEWPNLFGVINDGHRIYHGVDGGEGFFFQGKTEGLNEALQKFALVQTDAHEVVLLPGPAQVHSFDRATLDYDWSLKVNRGMISFTLMGGKGSLVWSKHPMLTVLIGGENIVLDKIHIPKGITVLEMSDLRTRYMQAIRESEDGHVRGFGAIALANLDHFSAASLATVANVLEDPRDWVRFSAIFALEKFGRAATPFVPRVRQMASTMNEDWKAPIEQAIAAIEAATNSPAADQERSNILQRITVFRKSLPKEK